jgi:hypothetical protein
MHTRLVLHLHLHLRQVYKGIAVMRLIHGLQNRDTLALTSSLIEPLLLLLLLLLAPQVARVLGA